MSMSRSLRRTSTLFLNAIRQWRPVEYAPTMSALGAKQSNDVLSANKGLFQVSSRGSQMKMSAAEEAAEKSSPQVHYEGRNILPSSARNGQMELLCWNQDDPSKISNKIYGFKKIEKALAERHIIIQQWDCNQPLPDDPSDKEVLNAYRGHVHRVMGRFRFETTDVLQMSSDFERIRAARRIYLSEHTHAEDEGRLMVDGAAAFYFNIEDRNEVVRVTCTKGTLLILPKQTKHWFDLSSEPYFRMIRFSGKPKPAGWTADYTGSDIAYDYPLWQHAN